MSAPQAPPGDAPQCPVAHFPSQPLPPGHPPTASHPASSLRAPTAPGCIFFRTTDDLASTPPLSRAASTLLEDAKRAANINPLAPGAAEKLDPATALVLASRNSQLALVQSSHVSAMLASHYGARSPAFAHLVQTDAPPSPPSATTPPSSPLAPLIFDEPSVTAARARVAEWGIPGPCAFPITSMSTAGDQNQRSPLYVIGGDGRAIWTKELEVALAAGAVDAIIHCLKDVPTQLPDGLMLGAILEREDPRDALVIKAGLPYKTLDELPPGSVIGTSSVRRVAQLRRRYPELVFSDVRGNLNTRLAKLDSPTGPYTALVLAAAGLLRLNFTSRITAFLSAPVLMYSVGQGSLAIEVRTPPAGATPATDRDARILAMVRSIGDWRATWRAECERALLRELEGGCSIPVGVDTRFSDHDQVEGKRNEGEAERLVAEARGVDAADTIRLDGHTIPADEAGSSRRQGGAAGAPKPPRLERLETGFEEAQAAAASAAAPVAPAPRLPDLSNMYPEYLADEPAEGATLSLHCCVVSLDGKRHCEYKLAALCRSVEDARELGRNVAKELSCARGARVILAEVERHRQLAEAADERRRREGRAARVAEVAGGPTRAAGEELDEREARRKLDEALAAASSGAGLNSKAANGEQQPWGLLANEVDRRGVPREDGQAKAWEV